MDNVCTSMATEGHHFVGIRKCLSEKIDNSKVEISYSVWLGIIYFEPASHFYNKFLVCVARWTKTWSEHRQIQGWAPMCLTKDSCFDEMEYSAVIWKRRESASSRSPWRTSGVAFSNVSIPGYMRWYLYIFHRYFDSLKTHFLQFIVARRMWKEFH